MHGLFGDVEKSFVCSCKLLWLFLFFSRYSLRVFSSAATSLPFGSLRTRRAASTSSRLLKTTVALAAGAPDAGLGPPAPKAGGAALSLLALSLLALSLLALSWGCPAAVLPAPPACLIGGGGKGEAAFSAALLADLAAAAAAAAGKTGGKVLGGGKAGDAPAGDFEGAAGDFKGAGALLFSVLLAPALGGTGFEALLEEGFGSAAAAKATVLVGCFWDLPASLSAAAAAEEVAAVAVACLGSVACARFCCLACGSPFLAAAAAAAAAGGGGGGATAAAAALTSTIHAQGHSSLFERTTLTSSPSRRTALSLGHVNAPPTVAVA